MEDIINYYKFKDYMYNKSESDLIEILKDENNFRLFVKTIEDVCERENWIYADGFLSVKLGNVIDSIDIKDPELFDRVKHILININSFLMSDELSREYVPFNWAASEEKRRCIPSKGLTCAAVSDMEAYIKYDYYVIKYLIEGNSNLYIIDPKFTLASINKLMVDFRDEFIYNYELYNATKNYLSKLSFSINRKNLKMLERTLNNFEQLSLIKENELKR